MAKRRNGSTVAVGVLSHHNSKETKAILNAVEALGHDPVWIRRENVRSWIDTAGLHLEPAVDVVVNRLLLTKCANPHEELLVASLYDQDHPVLNRPRAVERAIDKFRTAAWLSRSGLAVPDAYLATHQRNHDRWSAHLDGTGVEKPTVGTNGQRMRRVDPGSRVNVSVDGRQAFVQEYVDATNGRSSDLRVYVVGGETIAAMERRAASGEWRANVSLGADVEPVPEPLDPAIESIAERAVDALDLDFAGVDLIDDDGRWTVLEVNATAGFKGLFEATGRSVAPTIARLAIERVGGTVDADRLAEIEATMDDSVPACKPDIDPEPDDPPVLGYTNRVRLSGANRSETVVAKADTGAKRTSIDTGLAGRLGLGPITGTTTVRSGTTTRSETRPLVEVRCAVAGVWQTVTASVTDRSDMDHPVILGRDLIGAYRLDIDRRVDGETT